MDNYNSIMWQKTVPTNSTFTHELNLPTSPAVGEWTVSAKFRIGLVVEDWLLRAGS